MFSITSDYQSHDADGSQAKPGSPARCRARRSPQTLSETPSPLKMSLSLSGALRPGSRYLLDHYLHSTGKKASAHVGNQGKYTPFTDALMPVANESTMLFESILTFSCFHLAANSSSLSMVDTLEQHSVALQSLKHGITKYSKGDRIFGIQLFLSMLMLTCTEVCKRRIAIIGPKRTD
jgi:hypothetical protein